VVRILTGKAGLLLNRVALATATGALRPASDCGAFGEICRLPVQGGWLGRPGEAVDAPRSCTAGVPPRTPMVHLGARMGAVRARPGSSPGPGGVSVYARIPLSPPFPTRCAGSAVSFGPRLSGHV